MKIILLGLMLLSLSPVFSQIDNENETNTTDKVEVGKLVRRVKLFFSVLSITNNRGCVTGKILNYTLKKILDPEIEASYVCLKNISFDKFEISWKLKKNQIFNATKSKLIFLPEGKLLVGVDSSNLNIQVQGLKYRFNKMIIYRVKKVTLREVDQDLSIKLANFIIPATLNGNISYVVNKLRFQYFKILGIRFKIKEI